MEGEFSRVFKILFRLSLKKLLAKQPIGVTAHGSVSPAPGPVPHAPTSALGTAKLSSKHMGRRPVLDILRLMGKVWLVLGMALFVIIPLRFSISYFFSPENLRLDYLLTAKAHGFWMFFVGFMLFPISQLILVANVKGRHIRGMILPSPINRKHVQLYNLTMAELMLFAITFCIMLFTTFILWDIVINQVAFFVFLFLGLFFVLNIIVNTFNLMTVVHSFGRNRLEYWGSILGYIILFAVCFYPMLLFSYRVFTSGGFEAQWIVVNKNAIARFVFMLPDTLLILISQDTSHATKMAILLLLAGITATSTGINYVLHTQRNSVAWKERYAFQRGSKNLDKRITSTKKKKPPRGWDAVEVKGLDIFSRMPQKKISEHVIHDRDFYIAMAILVIIFTFFVIIVSASPLLLLYFLLAIPIFILYPILQNLNLILSKDGQKFFKLIPEPPEKISYYFRKSIEKHSLFSAVLFIAIIYLPLIFLVSLGPYHLLIAAMAMLHLFVFLVMILNTIVIFDLKEAASAIKGHSLLKFFLPMYSSGKRESGVWFAVKDNLAIIVVLVIMGLLCIVFLYLPYIALLLFGLDNFIPLILHVVMIVALFFYVRASLVDNMLAYLSFNRQRVNKYLKLVPLAIFVIYLALEIGFITLHLGSLS